MKFDPVTMMVGLIGLFFLSAVWWMVNIPQIDPVQQKACETQSGRVFVRTATANFCVVGDRLQ